MLMEITGVCTYRRTQLCTVQITSENNSAYAHGLRGAQQQCISSNVLCVPLSKGKRELGSRDLDFISTFNNSHGG